MNRINYLLFVLLLSCIGSASFGQDTLPKFSVKNVGNNKVIVGWVNKYETVKQISIQRAFDSLGAYKTILSVTDPSAVQNGFADTKAPNDHMFYRLFIVLDKGMFFFTAAKKPVLDTARVGKEYTPETTNPLVKKPDFVPSFYVYTNREGYVFINLPDADKKKYRIKFFDEDGSLLFELKSIKETGLTLDKANFIHAGWFDFELYNDEKLVERNKFYLNKMF